MKPVILVTAGQENTKKNILQYHAYENYARWVIRAGGTPVLLCGSVKEYLRELACLCNGLFLTGGEDLDPSLYGQKDGGLCGAIDAVRDEAETELCRLFTEARKPVFGICRGLQMLNVFFDGTLTQDLKHDRAIEHPYHAVHDVSAVQGSWLEGAFGSRFAVNSYHHQAIDKLGKGLKAAAYAADGKIVEAVEHEHLPIVAVQWHPERMTGEVRYDAEGPDMAPVFGWLCGACKKEEN